MPQESTHLLILIGSRATGKTTVGRLLAAQFGWGFADVDEHVEAVAGKPITAIFASEGEVAFRDRESAALRALCSQTQQVIATGGGAILRAENRDLLRSAGCVVWLTATPNTIWARLQADATTATRRPNLTGTGGLEEVRTLLSQREPLYRETADFVIDADVPSPEAVAAAILSEWNGRFTSH